MRSLRACLAAGAGVALGTVIAACGQDPTTQPSSTLHPALRPTLAISGT